jgi:RNA polymerase sigma factor for flagellar operon FliA
MTSALESELETAGARPPLTRQEYEKYLPMVKRIAMRVARRVPAHVTVQDLVNCGWVGLLQAHRRARPGMPDDEFAAYASHRVRGAILDYLRQADPMARSHRATSRKIAETVRALSQKLGRSPDEEEVAAALGVDVDDYRESLQRVAEAGMARLEVVDFDAVASDDVLADEQLDKTQIVDAVTQCIDRLPERLKLVLGLYYQEGCTLQQIGKILGVTEGRACQLHSQAMHEIRAMMGRP